MLRLFAFVLLSLSFFLLLIGPTLTEAQIEGRSCVANQTMGVYKPLKQCPSLYKKWLETSSARNMLENDFSNGIWCCPNETNNRKRSIRAAPTPDNHAKAKAKCEEYSKLVNALPIPSIATLNEKTTPRLQHAAVVYDGSGNDFICGGTVISERFVLTAAHCIYNRHLDVPSTYWVRVGDLNLSRNDSDANVQQIRVIERITHPSYSRFMKYHNIALFKLEKDILFNEWVRPACLPYSLSDNTENKAIAATWGGASWDSINESLAPSEMIMNLVSQSECNDIYKNVLPSGVMADWQFCASREDTNICMRGSGGPLVIANNDHPRMWSLIGVTSMGRDCSSGTIFTRVYNYVSWIESIVWPNS